MGILISLTEIKQLIITGNFDEALIEIEQSNENQLDLKILKCVVLRKKEMFNAAILLGKEVFKEAHEINSLKHELGILVQLAHTSIITNQMDQASQYISEFDSFWKESLDEEKKEFNEWEGYIYHVKGIVNSLKGEIEQAIENSEKSLQIQNSVENSLEILATLNNLSLGYLTIGDYNKGEEYAKQQLVQAEELGQQPSLTFAFNNLGHFEEVKGEYDLALDYYTKALYVANEFNLGFSIGSSRRSIGFVHYLKGEYELAFKNTTKSLMSYEDLNMDIFASYTILQLIRISLKLGLTKQIDNYMLKLNKLDDSTQNKWIRVNKKMSQALILKNNPRSRDKMMAQTIFEEILNERVDVGTSSLAILNLSEILLDELKTYGSEEVLEEIEKRTRQLYELAQEHKLYPLIVEVLILRAKLSFLKLELNEATKIINQANLIAEERGLEKLVKLVENENKNLEKEIRLAAEITKRASPMQERMDKAEIIEYIEKMQHLISIGQ
ncbi:MAG: hypothetical protein GPJ54_21695 [Candidatus Heimdallarchaeota archaeon]|nr:hypothetical protein [Candidatus Heimdallarchaeota archaeon]